MPYFSWSRVSYVMFGFAVFAALVKLWSLDVSTPASLAAENRTDSEAPRVSNQTRTLDIAARKPPKLETRVETPVPNREYFARHTLDIPDGNKTPARRPETTEPVSEPPVFYRPASETSGSNGPAESGPVCGDLGDFPRSSRIVFPLQDDYLYSYGDTWGAARPQGGHEGTDLMTPSGVPEYAITDGTIVPVSGSNEEGWNTLGGYAMMVRADYDIGPVKEGDLFYYAHMDEKSTLPIGAKVRAGQVVGYSGDTGQGPEVTRGLFPPHLHLGWYDGGGDRSDLDSGAMNPYPLLEWLKRNGGSVVGGSGAEYCEGPRPDDAPSAGTDRWSFSTSPGKSPDLDTGTEDPRPSSVVKKRSTAAYTGESKRKERATRVTPQRRKNVRTSSQKASDPGKIAALDNFPRSPAPTGKQRRTDQPVYPEQSRALRERPSPAGSGENRRPTGPVPESAGERRDTETSPKRTNGEGGPGTGRSERPEKPKPPEESGCDAVECPVEADSPKTPGPQPEETTTEETTTSGPETATPEDGDIEVKIEKERRPGETVGPPAGEERVSEVEENSVP